LYSKKLHCFCCLERTTALTSRTVRAFSLEEYGEYHLVSLTLPWRLMSRTKWIMLLAVLRSAEPRAAE
jgi:hypothetical protein